MLDLHKLHIFVQVSQAGSFSAAAEHLYMSQPAVSQHIHELEAALGVSLFVRGRRGVVLTAEGKALHEYAERILSLASEAESAVINVANLPGGQISIGATSGAGTYLLPQWIQDFRERYPHIIVAMHTGTTAEIAAQLSARKIDLGFVEGELDRDAASRMEGTVLCNVPQLWVIGPKHPFWPRRSIPAKDLDGQAFIMRQRHSQSRVWLDEFLSCEHIRPLVVAEFDNPEAIKHSIATGNAIGVLPMYSVRAEIERDSLRALPVDLPLNRELRVVWDRAIPLAPIGRAFLAFASNCVHGGEPSVR